MNKKERLIAKLDTFCDKPQCLALGSQSRSAEGGKEEQRLVALPSLCSGLSKDTETKSKCSANTESTTGSKINKTSPDACHRGIRRVDSFTLLEFVVMITIIHIIAFFAMAQFRNITRQSFPIQERALLANLQKAAINYNTQYDRWYGETFAEDIISGLLDNPPPYQLFNGDIIAWSGWSTNRKTWKILFVPGPPATWVIGCPHHYSMFATYGSSWRFYVKSGKVENWYGASPGASFHRWP